MEGKEYIKNEQIIMNFENFTMRDLVPDDHLVVKLEKYVDWSFVHTLCDHLYSDKGAQRIDPVILFKIIFINILFDIHSIRETCRQIEVNNAYRWFLGLGLFEKVPDHSTISQNYRRRYKDNSTYKYVFYYVILQLIEHELIDPSVLYVDGTQIKANANKRKSHKEEAEEIAKVYQEILDKDIDNDREEKGKKPLKRKAKKSKKDDSKPEEDNSTEDPQETLDLLFDEEEVPEVKASEEETPSSDEEEEIEEESEEKTVRTITVSNTDPDSGFYHKGTHEQCFAYNANVACDKNGYILGLSMDPGNMHDSVAFFHLMAYLDEIFGDSVETYVADAGYSTAPICHTVHQNGQKIIVPYKRVAAKREGFFKKYQYKYDREKDCYVCPNGLILEYYTTTRNGKRVYRSDGCQCESCPFLGKCTESKNHVKVIERHIWEEDREEAIRLQKSDEGKEIYSHRKETIERVFAEGKRRHGLVYTLYTGIDRVTDYTFMTFAAMNLKKMCLYLARQEKYAQN